MAGRILVLDDEENYAEMLQDLLRGQNYRVDMATRPERAIDQLEEIPYDLVISDYKMPVMDGADFLKRARELYPNLPFILVSGLMNTPELVKVANMGVTLVMEKPLNTVEFLNQVARFSTLMTEEEMAAHAKEAQASVAEVGEVVASYPEEPRFFSAVSPGGKRFMQSAWAMVQSAQELFIFESIGGDADLVAKDISVWRGNNDLPVASFVLPDSNTAALQKLREIASGLEHSDTLCIRLPSAEHVAPAHELTAALASEGGAAANLLLIYILESDAAATCLDQAGAQGIVLPGLNERSSDLAAYARRFARLASERSGKKNCSQFTPEAAFLLLAYPWPRGYRELQDAVIQAVNATPDGQAITLAALQQTLDAGGIQVPAPEARLAVLMHQAQTQYFAKMLSSSGVSPAELAQKLELENSVQNQDDLAHLPLVKSELAKL